LRGLLRAHLEREAPLLSCGAAELESLFGVVADQKTHFGRLEVRDATAGVVPRTEIRDHVRIDGRTGAAAFGAKFDMETGTEEAFSFAASYEGEGASDRELLLVKEGIRFLASEAFHAGAKQGWGLGRMALDAKSMKVLAFDRSTPDGLCDYLGWRLNGTSPAALREIPAEAVGGEVKAAEKAWNRVELELELQFEGPMLIKRAIPADGAESEGVDLNDPETYWRKAEANADGRFVTTIAQNGRHYLPGTSFRGVLRHEAAWIAGEDAARMAEVEKLFGFAKAAREGEAGRISICDGELQGEARIVALDHVAIDRIVGSAANGKKFDAAALASPCFRIKVAIQFEAEHRGLLRWVRALLRQMESGRLWVGSASSRGYGLLKSGTVIAGKADLVDGLGWEPKGLLVVERRPGRSVYDLRDGAAVAALWGCM